MSIVTGTMQSSSEPQPPLEDYFPEVIVRGLNRDGSLDLLER